MAIFLVEKISLKQDERGLEKYKEVYIIPKLNIFIQADTVEKAMGKCGVVALPVGFPRGCSVFKETSERAKKLYGESLSLGEFYPSTVFKFTELEEQIKPLRPW